MNGPEVTVTGHDEAEALLQRLSIQDRERQIERELEALRREVPPLEELVAQAREQVGVRARQGRLRKTDSYAPVRDLTVAERQLEENQRTIADHEKELQRLRHTASYERKVSRLADIAAKAEAAERNREKKLQKLHDMIEKMAIEAAEADAEIEYWQLEWGRAGGPQFAYENRWTDEKRRIVESVAQRVSLEAIKTSRIARANPNLGEFNEAAYTAFARGKIRLGKP